MTTTNGNGIQFPDKPGECLSILTDYKAEPGKPLTSEAWNTVLWEVEQRTRRGGDETFRTVTANGKLTVNQGLSVTGALSTEAGAQGGSEDSELSIARFYNGDGKKGISIDFRAAHTSNTSDKPAVQLKAFADNNAIQHIELLPQGGRSNPGNVVIKSANPDNKVGLDIRGILSVQESANILGGLTVTGEGITTHQIKAPSELLKIDGNLQIAGSIIPSAGNNEEDKTKGIIFPNNIGSGSGDSAWIRYYARDGEKCTLEIGASNDSDDHIALIPSGNVGIGINNPTSKLHVSGGDLRVTKSDSNQSWGLSFEAGDQNTASQIKATATNGTRNIKLLPQGTFLGSTYQAGQVFVGENADNQNANLAVYGNVGIDTTTPSAKLHIAGFGGDLLSVGEMTGIGNINLTGHVQLREYGQDGVAYLQARDDNSNRDIALRFRTQKHQDSGTPGLTEAMTIRENGNIGIGINNPTSQLHVNGGDLKVTRSESNDQSWGLTWGLSFEAGQQSAASQIKTTVTNGIARNIELLPQGTGSGNTYQASQVVIGQAVADQAADLTVHGMANAKAYNLDMPVLQFTERTDEVVIPSSNHLNPIEKWTVELWFKCDRTDVNSLLYSKSTVYAGGIRNNKFQYAWSPWEWRGDNFPVDPGIWYHAAVVYDGNRQILYRNGREVYKNESTEVMAGRENTLNLMAEFSDESNEKWSSQGSICEFRIWSVARSAEEIRSHMNLSLQGNEDELVGYWPMKEGQGNTVYDKTSYASHGNITGAKWSQREAAITPTVNGSIQVRGKVCTTHKVRGFSIYLKGTCNDGSSIPDPEIKINNNPVSMSWSRGINTVIITSFGVTRTSFSYDVYGENTTDYKDNWEAWADAVNRQALPGDMIVVVSKDAIRKPPDKSSDFPQVTDLLEQIKAEKIYSVTGSRMVMPDVRRPYCLIFRKDGLEAIEELGNNEDGYKEINTAYFDFYPEQRKITYYDDWQFPVLLGGWNNFEGDYIEASYFKDALGMVHLRGLIKDGTSGTEVFHLPIGYRPEKKEVHPIAIEDHSNNSLTQIGRLDIYTDGTVQIVQGNSSWSSLSGVSFRASD